MSPRRLARRRQSLTSRVTAFTALAVAITVTVMSLAAYFTVRERLYSGVDSRLLSRATNAAAPDATGDLARQQVATWDVGATGVQIALVSASGQVESAQESVPGFTAALGDQEAAVARGDTGSVLRTADAPEGRFRIVAVPVGGSPGLALVLGQPLTPTEQTLQDLGLVLFILGVLGVLFAAAAGALIAARGLRPVRLLTEAFEQVARTETLTPIEITGTDELARLTGAFNTMIASLSASRDLQAQLVTDAGHELRTPLTSLRTNLDLLHQAEVGEGLDHAARLELLTDVSAQIEELTNLIGSLSELARGDSPHSINQRVDLSDVLERALERVRREAHGLTLHVTSEDWPMTGDESALERAVGNLLENAVTWSPAGGTVWVTLSQGVLTVEDEGPGIASSDIPYVFDRFYRAPESRSLPGSGLGLSVVKHVAERHGGSVAVSRSPHGGAAFVLALPANDGPSSQGTERRRTGSVQ